MRDFNFFEPFVVVKKPVNSKKLIGAFALLVVVMGLIVYQVFMFMKIGGIESEIADLKGEINAPETKNKLSIVDAKMNQEAALQLVASDLELLELRAMVENVADDMFMDSVNAQVPEGVFVTELRRSDGQLSLKGFSESYEGIAQLAYNLRGISPGYVVGIPEVTDSEGAYYYTITLEFELPEVEEVANEN